MSFIQYPLGTRVRIIEISQWLAENNPEVLGKTGRLIEVEKPSYSGNLPYHVELDEPLNGEFRYWATDVVPTVTPAPIKGNDLEDKVFAFAEQNGYTLTQCRELLIFARSLVSED